MSTPRAAAQESARISLRIVPRAKRNEIVGWQEDGSLKVRIKATPVDGKANQALILFLSSILRIHKADVEISSGEKSRIKLITVWGMTEKMLLMKIDLQLGS